MPNLTANVGEWSEAYVFFRILGEHMITTCDAHLEPILQSQFPVTEIKRGCKSTPNLTYRYVPALNQWQIFVNDEFQDIVTATEGQEEAMDLLHELLNHIHKGPKSTPTSNGKALSFPKAEKFLYRLHTKAIKAQSTDKKDITLTIRDIRAGCEVESGFSIKSFLSQPPTLLNASQLTIFQYEVTGVSNDKIAHINEQKIGKFVPAILQAGGKITWVSMHEQYRQNMLFIDTAMPTIAAHLLLDHFSSCHLPQKRKSVRSVTEHLAQIDPLHLASEKLYAYKVKKLLEATALGMVPGQPWEGIEEANGGFIIVKPEGDIVTFHIYNRNLFMEYLYQNTIFEHPSTHRYPVGKITEQNGKLIFGLPLNIRYAPIK